MLRTVFAYVYFVLVLIVFAPPMLWVRCMKKKWSAEQYNEMVYRITKGWARSLIWVSGARVRVTGTENVPANGAVLYVSNHQSDFDIVTHMAYLPRPKGFVAKIEMLKVPLLRTWMKYMQCVFMDRKDIRQSARIILDGINILKNGHSMVVFPEGTRSKSEDMLEFKQGSFKLATKAKVPIVPVTVNGSYRVVEANNYKIKPADINLTIHPPVETANLSPEELAALPGQIEEIIRSGLRLS